MGKDKRQSGANQPIIPPGFVEPLVAVQQLIERFDNRGVIIGGVAASLLGRARLTVDLDAVILLSTNDLDKLIDFALNEGMTSRIVDAVDFARKNRVLLLRHDQSGRNIDIYLGILPFETEMVERAQKIMLGDIQVRLPTPEDLILMKAVAHRPKDFEDIRAVAASHHDLDKKRIRYWLEQFGTALELPSLWN